jgi:hypothetical protein
MGSLGGREETVLPKKEKWGTGKIGTMPDPFRPSFTS